MLGARIDIIQPQIRNLIANLLPLQTKKQRQLWLNEIKRVDWTETIVKNACVCWNVSKKYFFFVMGASEDFLHLTTVLYEKTLMSVCMCVKQQLKIYIIICNCIYNVFTSSSWLDRHCELVFTIHVSRAVVLESGLGLVLDSLVFGLGLVSDLVIGLAKCSSWSRPSPAIYAFFSLSKQRLRLFRKWVM